MIMTEAQTGLWSHEWNSA